MYIYLTGIFQIARRRHVPCLCFCHYSWPNRARVGVWGINQGVALQGINQPCVWNLSACCIHFWFDCSLMRGRRGGGVGPHIVKWNNPFNLPIENHISGSIILNRTPLNHWIEKYAVVIQTYNKQPFGVYRINIFERKHHFF